MDINMPTQSQETSAKFKRKAGRKPLLDIERRSFKYHNCYTRAEIMHIKAAALRSGLSDTEYIRHAVLNREVKTVPMVNKSTYEELGKIGVNINQMARLMNGGSRNDEALVKGVNALTSMLAEIRRELLGVHNANI